MSIKKITTLLMLSVLPLGALTAQIQMEKDYLPKAGDWAIGIDMQPVYRFIGNIANGTQNNELEQFGGEPVTGFGFLNNNIGFDEVSIMGKYMLDNTTAIRLNVGFGKMVEKHKEYRPDALALFLNPLSEAKVEDFYKQNAAEYSISAGIEFRKGKDRIQGFYGADLLFAKEKEIYKMEYGNAITELNQNPSRTPYYNNLGIGVQDVPYWTSTYLTESYQNEYILGIAGKLGVEYFIAPKLSLGGEVSLLMAKQFEKGSYIKTEGYNATTERVESHTELVDPKNSTFYMGTMDLGGKLFMMFYF